MKIKTLEMLTLNIPFYCDRVSRHMHRALTHGERVYVYRVELDNGIIGYGESMGDESGNIVQVVGQNPFALMQDDGIGFGIQMSFLDAVGKTVEVPIYQLLGKKVRERCPISWWDIDMPPEDWVEEAKESVKRGYTSIKLKARPWRDIFAQVEAVGKVVPEGYQFDIDFNGFLRTADGAIPVLQALDKHPNVAIYESPFYLGTDLEGAGRLQAAAKKPIVEHFNEPCLHARCCGGFVVGGGATGTRRVGALCASFDRPFWLQMVGTGITTAYTVHIGAILTHAKFPAITCHELWEDDLLKERLEVVDGTIQVPENPGLGIEVDESALERYRVEPGTPPPQTLYRQKKRICRVHLPNSKGGETLHDFTGEDVYYPAFSQGKYPGFVRGVWLEVIEDEG
ncbi:mandelate racemase/muconate lactonizing enzyme family protein [Candidatus Poribacteria bacterium]|nr:mandelate racemase/muconate lactonizing enzyme family protein [Candidatus Poribacteria bacterium]